MCVFILPRRASRIVSKDGRAKVHMAVSLKKSFNGGQLSVISAHGAIFPGIMRFKTV